MRRCGPAAGRTRSGPTSRARPSGLVGLGRLGAGCARVGLAFGMEVLAWSQNLDPAVAREQGVAPVSKDGSWPGCRRGLAAPEAERPDARHRRCRRSSRAMRRSAYLVNTSRGPLVDEEALLEGPARRVRSPGRGSTCTTRSRCPTGHPLRTAPRLVLTPHLGYVTDGGYRLFYGGAVDDIAAWRAGEPVRVDHSRVKYSASTSPAGRPGGGQVEVLAGGVPLRQHRPAALELRPAATGQGRTPRRQPGRPPLGEAVADRPDDGAPHGRRRVEPDPEPGVAVGRDRAVEHGPVGSAPDRTRVPAG